MRKILVVLGFSLILFIFVMIGFVVGKNAGEKVAKTTQETKANNIKNIPLVKLKSIELKDIPLTISGDGRVTASNTLKVTSEVQGKIINGILKKGMSFTQGQVIYSMDNTEYLLSLKARKSNFITQVASILPDIQLDYASSFSKWNTFFTNLSPEKSLPSLPVTETTKEKTFISTKGILAEYYTIKSMEERLTKYTFIAPFSGSIVSSYAEKGTIVNPGSPILDIIQNGTLEIEIPLTIEAANLIKIGKTVKLKDKKSQQEYLGTVIRKGDFINSSTQSIPVYVQVNGTKNLYNGMYLTATFVTDIAKNVVELPKSAIYEKGFVYIVNDSIASKQVIQIINEDPSTVYVNGIENGNKVVTNYVPALEDGLKVRPIDIKQ